MDHMAREASSVRRYPSSLPSRAAWSCLTKGSGLSGMVRSTLHADRTCRQSEVPAFFGETIQFPGQQGEAGLLYQGHFLRRRRTLPRSMSTVIRASSWTGASATTVPQGSTTCE